MEKEKAFFMSGALDEHYLKAKKQMEYDKRALEITKKGLDVPVSHTQVKSHQDTV